jgi:hypothetical protein
MTTSTVTCGHTTGNGGWHFECNLPQGHRGLHRQTIELRDGLSVTTWGDDGKAMWATSDSERLAGRGGV